VETEGERIRLKIGRADKRRIRGALGIDFDLGKYNVGPTAFFEVPCRISVAADLARDFSVGAFTTISPSDGNGRFLHNLSIGRYCSIAAGVWVAPHEHPIPWLMTNPISYGDRMFKWTGPGAESLVSVALQKVKTIEVPNFTAANSYFVDNLDNGVGKKRVLSVGITNIADFLPSREMMSG
jgi:hypothetical protein